MKKAKLPPTPQTEYEKLQYMFVMYEKILHPDFWQPFYRQLGAVYEENKKEAYAQANISEQALLIERWINDLKKDFERIGDSVNKEFLIKCLYKKILTELL